MNEDDDLGALCAWAGRRLAEAEQPVLAEHGLSMWQYVVLSALARGSAPSQLVLAQQIHYDKTRLIALLDGLVAEGLVSRDPDPADRRARVVRLTALGLRRHAAARDAIRAVEDGLLEGLDGKTRRALRSALAHLANAD
ncbi:MarR family transcriptional regulator [Amycolatopsis sp. SID8362]|uniref:MarR family winged helix-turn-helix transcriptional regulator n=1 Tax=Amycolatopsis sp. SID8362 TaxID=2690346 RepID=UPI00136C85E5|nr:MarR family transcriptional regulator [Amycolatopsis sp. SID8362]NBH02093.1 MarR family transcriptional regulator [Amycolatopsis sp. SID8362]NED38796.1 MarR family transcriptional regulator [Amycolatopsis sp. SID8362]